METTTTTRPLAACCVGALVLLGACSASPDPAPSTAAAATTTTTVAGSTTGVVERVIDGDTIVMRDGTHVRLIGIDTPERGEPCYDEATEALDASVADQIVTLVPGTYNDRDRYGRLLRYVDIGDLDAGLTQIHTGLAVARYDSRDGYGPHTRESEYVAADAATPAAANTGGCS